MKAIDKDFTKVVNIVLSCKNLQQLITTGNDTIINFRNKYKAESELGNMLYDLYYALHIIYFFRKEAINNMKQNEIPEILLTENGYPTEEWLEFIKNFVPDNIFTIKKFIDLLQDGWNKEVGSIKLPGKYNCTQKLELHTGGWSGNEEIMEAILSNINLTDLVMKYKKWERGGHYYFEFPVMQ